MLLLAAATHAQLGAPPQVAGHAQSDEPPHDDEKYLGLVQQAIQQCDLGNFLEAQVLFEQAHRVFPNARTLRGLGLVAYALRDYVVAVQHLDAALTNPVRPLDAAMSTQVRETAERSQALIGSIQVRLDPDTTELTIDGRPAKPDPDHAIRANPGEHELVATAAGYSELSRRVNLEPGSHLALDMRLQPIALAPAPAPREVATSRGAGPFILIGGSAALAIGGGVLLGIALDDVATVEHAARNTRWADIEPSYERSTTFSTIGIALLGLGGLGIVSGLAWYLWPTDRPDTLAVRVAPGGFVLHGKF